MDADHGRPALRSVLQLQPKLDRAWPVGGNGMEKAVTGGACGCPGGIACGDISVTADRVTGRVAPVSVVEDELGVIEDVERLGTKLKTHLVPHPEVFQQSHVEVRAIWIVEVVSPSIALR